ncbi:polyphosphate kinase 2 [Bacteroidia bacterium]|nr:polyphosphate kinase 2 [Bacteroidia bacterium]MDC1395096.1 polyphosphate kinase 2 [Bacteroidia bacterium]
MKQFSEREIELLNSKVGLMHLLKQDDLNYSKALRNTYYEKKLVKLQTKLVDLQDWVINNKKRVIVILEGRDAAGKGGAIRRMTAHINPRHFKVIALPKPNENEQEHWYFRRYVNLFPNPGQIVFFDRSWYNRAVVEPVNDFCTEIEYDTFMNQVNDFEKMITDSGIYLLKIYFSISKYEQLRRFEAIKSDPLKRWKMTPVDEKAQELWDNYTEYKKKMFKHTDTKNVPWKILKANRKTSARLEAIQYILDNVPYKEEE